MVMNMETENLETIPELECNRVIKNGDVFSSKYIPSEIYRRSEELSQIEDELIMSIKTHGSGSLLLAGAPGTGKTLLIRYAWMRIQKALHNIKDEKLREEIKPDLFEFKEFNCRDYYTSRMVLAALANVPYKKIPVPDMRRRFCLDGKKTVVVLDEVDMLIDDDILYWLSRPFSDINGTILSKEVFPVLITNVITFPKTLKPNIRTRIRRRSGLRR